MMASAFYAFFMNLIYSNFESYLHESNLRYCLIAETYKSKSFFLSTVISIKCPFYCFYQVSF